tara:strand:- start:233 stop:586 length:354 start_codon:yes stop_codon:yes gene_type:complete
MPNKRTSPQTVGTFKEAFRQAKNSGVKTFMWKGTKYNTKTQDVVKDTPSKKKKTNTSNYMTSYTTPKYAAGGKLKEVPAGNKGLSKLPTNVRNKMGYMKKGGKIDIRYKGGGIVQHD